MASSNLLRLLSLDSDTISEKMSEPGVYPHSVSYKDIDAVIYEEFDFSINILPANSFRDEFSVIAVNYHDSVRLGIRSGDIIEAAIVPFDLPASVGENVNDRNHFKKVVGMVYDRIPHSGSSFMNWSLFSSLRTLAPKKFYIHDFLKQSFCKIRVMEPGNINIENLDFATTVVVSLINSPHHDNMPLDILLKRHFFHTRFLQEGDIFALKTEDDPKHWKLWHGEVQTRIPHVYFKVQRMLPRSGLLVNSSKSDLLQDRSIHSFIPQASCLSQLLKGWNLLSTWGNKAKDLCESIQSHLHIRNAKEKMFPFYLLVGLSGAGIHSLSQALAEDLFLHFYFVNCECFDGHTSAHVETSLKQVFDTAKKCSPCLIFFDNIGSVCRDQEGHEDIRVISTFQKCIKDLVRYHSEWPIVIMAATSCLESVSTDIQKLSLQLFYFENPDFEQRINTLKLSLYDQKNPGQDSIEKFAQQTGGFGFEQLKMFLTFSRQVAWNIGASSIFKKKHFRRALKSVQSLNSVSLAFPKIAHVAWSDIGGLEKVKQEVINTIQFPLKNPQLMHAGIRRSGILLFGPPGTGKTLIAKAVSTECSLRFLSVKGPELLSMYVGQSEENVREVFRRAVSFSPSIIFFDELDSLAPNRGRTGDSGGVMDRVVSQLLAEMDGISKSANVFMIGATNRPDLIDPALLRPGRFDKLVYLGIDTNFDSRLKVLQSITKKFKFEDVFLQNILRRCPPNTTGADLYALCSDALHFATRKCVESAETCNFRRDKTADDVIVTESDFFQALENLVPSLTFEDLSRYHNLREQFSP